MAKIQRLKTVYPLQAEHIFFFLKKTINCVLFQYKDINLYSISDSAGDVMESD